jgi:hypothetical protein
MRKIWPAVLLFSTFVWNSTAFSEDWVKRVKKSAEMSTLDQASTVPFHLKATLAPSYEQNKQSGRTGEIEIWWVSPIRWRREIRCPDFHQVQIVDGGRIWQKNDGAYFPEWLREIANAITRPVELTDELSREIQSAEVKRLMGTTYLSWSLMSSNGEVQKSMGGGISIKDDSGLLVTADGTGWGGWYRDYSKFHNLQVARTVSEGSPEVTAKIIALDDLGPTQADWFDTALPGGDPQPLKTVVLDELEARKNLQPGQSLSWPPVQDGPLEGVLTTDVIIDRAGNVQEIGTIVSDNPGMSEAARQQIAALRFKPFIVNGDPVQVCSRITLAFKTARPQGVETFESARVWFERGRKIGFPAAGSAKPYILRADFQMRGSSSSVLTGHYEDTWVSETQWRREATVGYSHFVRARNGEKLYRLSEGPEANLLSLVFQILEPIPALDTFVESDWRIKSDIVDGVKTVRVLSGYESPEGKLDPERARGFWFDPSAGLVKTFFNGIETRRTDLQDFDGTKVAHRIDVLKDDKLGMRINIAEIIPAGTVPKSTFEIKGHEWTRAFTAEVR